MIRAPAGLFALWCSCCCFSGKNPRPLDWFFCHSNCGYFVNRFAKAFALNTVFFLENGQCVFPRYHFVKISFYQSIVLPILKYHFAKISFCQSIILPNIVLPKYPKLCFAKYQFATICLQNDQNDRSKSSQNKNLGRPQTPHFAQYLRVMVPLEPSSPVIATRTFRKYQS